MGVNKKYFNWDGKLVQLIEILVDLAIIIGSYILAVIIVSNYTIYDLLAGDVFTRDFIITIISIAIGAVIFIRVYKISITKRGYISTMFRIAVSLGIIGLMLLLLSFVYYIYSLPKSALGLMLVFQISVLAVTKGMMYLILKRVNIKTCMIFGPKEEVHNLAKKILFDDNKFIELKYLVYDDFDNGEIKQVLNYINTVDYVYLTENLSSDKKNTVISYCFKIMKKFYLVPKLYELSINKASVTQVGDKLVYGINGLGLSFEQRLFKRIFDISFSSLALLILSPFMLIISIIVKTFDHGPILFKQERITRNNKKFMLYKFRSMIPNAEKETGPIQASINDHRITKVGKFLRKTRLDELPQLINVLKGDMSIVGPRALRVEEVNDFIKQDAKFAYRSNVKAGITGYAQTMGTYSTVFNDKLKFDIFYITNYSFFNDIVILLHTVRSVLDPNSSKGVSKNNVLEKNLNSEGYHILSTDSKFIQVVVKK